MSEESFKGDDRFTIRRRLGTGAMGVVYEAYDALTRETVALKTIKHAKASAIYRLKNEFRSLADISHPNLVSLFELFIQGNVCFFTMELVEGVDFVSYTVGQTNSREHEAFETVTRSFAVSEVPPGEHLSSSSMSPGFPLQASPPRALATFEKLYATLPQLAAGLCALHEGGKLHRDIKPSNILVSRQGRVVILDFGLATPAEPEGTPITQGFFGTPAYVSPEQASDKALAPASDWYSVGVTLYQALTGRFPFDGSFLEVMNKKQYEIPVAPSRIVAGVPKDLDELCLALLNPEPAARPSGRQVLSLFSSPVLEAAAVRSSPSLVGRERHLATLRKAFDAVKGGATAKVYVYGGSGMGKSALVRTFLRELGREQEVLVLAARCYERESIPYKAFDGVVDSLTRYLVSLPTERAQGLLPRDLGPIAQMFPVLARVEAITGYRPVANKVLDPLALRRRAFTSLQELIGRISDRQPVVIFIDDLHWSDSDSITLLEHLVRPPDAPRLLLIATFRSDEARKAPHLNVLLDEIGKPDCIEIALDALSNEEARVLTRSLSAKISLSQEFVEMVVRESGGNPFLIEQLVCWAAGGGATGAQTISVGEMLEENIRQLPDGAQVVLETLSVAARPIPASIAFRASGLTAENSQLLVASLRSAKFLRAGSARQPLELYHDRIREYVASLLSAERKRLIHQNLAESLMATGLDDPELLFAHQLGAGHVELATRYALLAAAKASAALAFDQAAVFWRWALELTPHSQEETVRLKSELGHSLANAGRPAEAAAVYLEAAELAGSAKALDLQRRAAEQFLLSGHVDEGMQVIRTVLDRIGLRLAAGPAAALVSLLVHRFELRLRGLQFKERRVDEVPADELLRVDTCWTVAAGLAMVDNIRGADFQTRHLLLALCAGEPYRIARALATEAGFTATLGSRSRRRAERFSRMAQELADRVENPHAVAMAKMTAGVSKFLFGEWRNGLALCETAYEILRDQCTGVSWELTIAQNFILGSLRYLGEFREIQQRLPTMLTMANERGNLYAATEIKTRMNFHWLIVDDPEGARRELADALTAWSHAGFHRQHFNALLAEAQIALYTGDPVAAQAVVDARWPDLRRTLLLRIQLLRIETVCLKARILLALAERQHGGDMRLIAQAEGLARQINRENMRWADPLAWLLQAGAAALRADKRRALGFLQQAIEGFENADMALYTAVARWSLDEIQRAAPGAGRAGFGGQWMERQGVKNPNAILRVLAPGFSYSHR
jgi:serine/threonine protein kinase